MFMASRQERDLGHGINRSKTQQRMTILAHDRYFSIWQRAKVRLHSFVGCFKDWLADKSRLPDRWTPRPD